MLIGFFIGIVLLITLVLFAINPITRAINNSIAKHNLAAEKRRLKEEEIERRENELEAIRRESEELREKLKLETEINDELRKQSAERFYNQSSVSTNRHEPIRTFDQDYYDWGLDEPVGALKRRRFGDWEIL
jgi:F0F1-type ATP synthase membrane subunit b/b'